MPILAFVNSRSGGQVGEAIQAHLRKLLPPSHVVSLPDTSPTQALTAFRNAQQERLAKEIGEESEAESDDVSDFSYRVLVCGGDGTVAWVLSAIDEVGRC